MPVFDQYDVEPSLSYSGSYTDNAFYGDILLGTGSNTDYILARGYTRLGVENPRTSRRIITSKTTGKSTISPTINRMWMPGYLFEGYASGSFLGRPQRFQSFFSNEYWYDSYMPSAMDIYIKNGGVPIGIVSQSYGLGNSYTIASGSDYGIYPYPDLTASLNVRPALGIAIQDKYYLGAPLAGLDHIWSYSFPFESKYKEIIRLENFSSRYPTDYQISTFAFVGSASPPSQSNDMGLISTLGPLGINYYIGAMAYPTLTYPPTSFSDSSFKLGTIHPLTFNNVFFGIGNGGATTKSGVGENKPWLSFSFFGTTWNWFVYVIPRGYKHGIRSVAPEQTKITYRIGRYGQVRDMLEGRPYTARLIPAEIDAYTGATINRTLDFPLQINYTTGTLIYSQSRDYVTATNPSYNPYDSGIYDVYYRSGQPFFDR